MITASTKPIERWHHLARQVEAKERLFRFPKATFEFAVDNECRPRRRQIKEKRTRRPSAPVQTAPQEEARRGSFQPNWPRPAWISGRVCVNGDWVTPRYRLPVMRRKFRVTHQFGHSVRFHESADIVEKEHSCSCGAFDETCPPGESPISRGRSFAANGSAVILRFRSASKAFVTFAKRRWPIVAEIIGLARQIV
jgi:hypothetical protein